MLLKGGFAKSTPPLDPPLSLHSDGLFSILATADEIVFKIKALSCDCEESGREKANTQ